MNTIALTLIGLISALHFYIAWFEIFAWTSRGPAVFESFPPELFEQTVQMAANQGKYNAFLAVGLLWSLLIRDPKWQINVATCFLGSGPINPAPLASKPRKFSGLRHAATNGLIANGSSL